MADSTSGPSAFTERGFSATIDDLKTSLKKLYQSDDTPWVIGYSGGKDSTAVVQLVWLALAELEADARKKPVYVITTDTLVENPIVASWVSNSLDTIKQASQASELPFDPRLITPDVQNTFWVNLIGKGYPAPRPKFRWCTDRLKIKPSSQFIEGVASRHGEVILFLGTRKAESAVRAARMNRQETEHFEGLSPHPDLVNTLVCSPIRDWTNDDVWTFLMRIANPWGHSNKELLSMYRGATEDNECPVVVDTSTPSCGSSRFGCWVCTLVDQDKSMGAMIQNDVEKEWMLPLLELRNEFEFRGDEARERDRSRRDYRRLGGFLSHYRDKDGEIQLVPGPYTQESRNYWLRRLLATQTTLRKNPSSPEHIRDLELISLEELQEIRRIWINEKHEIEDYLPTIYEEEVGQVYPGEGIDENLVFDRETLDILREVCDGEELLYETTRNLLDVERRYRTKGRRHGLFEKLDLTIRHRFYSDKDDALQWLKRQHGIADVPQASTNSNTIAEETSSLSHAEAESDSP